MNSPEAKIIAQRQYVAAVIAACPSVAVVVLCIAHRQPGLRPLHSHPQHSTAQQQESTSPYFLTLAVTAPALIGRLSPTFAGLSFLVSQSQIDRAPEKGS